MKYYLWIIGCQYNEWDGSRLNFFMQKLGFIESSAEEADVILILACSVRQTAVDRILGRTKNWLPKKIKGPMKPTSFQAQPSKLVIVTGCVLEADRPKLEGKGIQIFESGDLRHLFEILSEYFDDRFDYFKVGDFRQVLADQNTQSQYIPIMSGCDNFCTYCAVPYTRGREKSRSLTDILSDANNLISKGHKEIMLLGQNVNSYKSNLPKHVDSGKQDFTLLLEKLNDIEGDFVVSFTSNHPKDMSEDIIAAVASLSKIKKCIHLPLQSGSDKILKAMNRPYTKSQYLDIVKKIRESGPEIEITTDIIVGFPGESETEFQKTVEVVQQVGYSQAYINKYSVRKGTAAEKLGDPITWAEKNRRWNVLNDIVYRK